MCTALAVLRRISFVRALADFFPPFIIADETAATAAPAAMPRPTPFTTFMLCLYMASNLQIQIAAFKTYKTAVTFSFPLFTKTYIILPERTLTAIILNIVMVEPEIPQNAGNVARTCAATGARLHLVGPMGFKIDDKKLKRAGLDYWHLLDITYYDSLDEFFAKNSGEFFFFSTKSVHKHTDIHYPDNCYLFFGKETAGLPEDLLFKNKDRCVRIPMISEARSLNLSNSIAIGVYEVLRQWDFPALSEAGRLRGYDWDAADANGAK